MPEGIDPDNLMLAVFNMVAYSSARWCEMLAPLYRGRLRPYLALEPFRNGDPAAALGGTPFSQCRRKKFRYFQDR
jgi:hypothetical protein